MPANAAKTIRAKIEHYAKYPESMAANVKPLQGVDAMRLRVGDWRVVFSETGKEIAIIKIASRGSIYE